jgi:hypothetical protein
MHEGPALRAFNGLEQQKPILATKHEHKAAKLWTLSLHTLSRLTREGMVACAHLANQQQLQILSNEAARTCHTGLQLHPASRRPHRSMAPAPKSSSQHLSSSLIEGRRAGSRLSMLRMGLHEK